MIALLLPHVNSDISFNSIMGSFGICHSPLFAQRALLITCPIALDCCFGPGIFCIAYVTMTFHSRFHHSDCRHHILAIARLQHFDSKYQNSINWRKENTSF